MFVADITQKLIWTEIEESGVKPIAQTQGVLKRPQGIPFHWNTISLKVCTCLTTMFSSLVDVKATFT